jgi:hypothetical protein
MAISMAFQCIFSSRFEHAEFAKVSTLDLIKSTAVSDNSSSTILLRKTAVFQAASSVTRSMRFEVISKIFGNDPSCMKE